MGERDAEQSLHLASPRGGSSLPLQVRRLRSLSHILLLLGQACPLPALGRQMFLQARAQTPLLLIAERLVLPLALFSGYILFSLRDIKMKPYKTQQLPTTCHLEMAAASFPCTRYRQQVSAARPPPRLSDFGHRKSCRRTRCGTH